MLVVPPRAQFLSAVTALVLPHPGDVMCPGDPLIAHLASPTSPPPLPVLVLTCPTRKMTPPQIFAIPALLVDRDQNLPRR